MPLFRKDATQQANGDGSEHYTSLTFYHAGSSIDKLSEARTTEAKSDLQTVPTGHGKTDKRLTN